MPAPPVAHLGGRAGAARGDAEPAPPRALPLRLRGRQRHGIFAAASRRRWSRCARAAGRGGGAAEQRLLARLRRRLARPAAGRRGGDCPRFHEIAEDDPRVVDWHGATNLFFTHSSLRSTLCSPPLAVSTPAPTPSSPQTQLSPHLLSAPRRSTGRRTLWARRRRAGRCSSGASCALSVGAWRPCRTSSGMASPRPAHPRPLPISRWRGSSSHSSSSGLRTSRPSLIRRPTVREKCVHTV